MTLGFLMVDAMGGGWVDASIGIGVGGVVVVVVLVVLVVDVVGVFCRVRIPYADTTDAGADAADAGADAADACLDGATTKLVLFVADEDADDANKVTRGRLATRKLLPPLVILLLLLLLRCPLESSVAAG